MLSYDEHHKHLHLNVHNESQLNVSSLFKDIFPPHYSLFGNTSVTTIITLKGLLVDNHMDLIIEKDNGTRTKDLGGKRSVLCPTLLL